MNYYCYDCREWFRDYDEDLQECPKCGVERGVFVDEDEYDDREWELSGGELEQDEEGNWGHHGDL